VVVAAQAVDVSAVVRSTAATEPPLRSPRELETSDGEAIWTHHRTAR